MKKKNNRILVFAAHPDDAELGMGGVIMHMTQRGYQVKIVDLTDGEPTPAGNKQTRKRESQRAAKILGFKRQTLDYSNRQLQFSIEKRDRVAGIIRKFRPAAVFSHYFLDAHPDHVAAGRIVDDAVFAARLTKTDIPGDPYRLKKMYYYFSSHLRKIFVPDFFILVSKSEYRAKMEALRSYASQFADNTDNTEVLEYIKTRDKYWGFISGGKYAEGFCSREVITVEDFDMVV